MDKIGNCGPIANLSPAHVLQETGIPEASFFGNVDEQLEQDGLRRSRTSSSEDSTSTEKESAVEAMPDNLDVDVGTSATGPMSRAESIYYTPDATSDQLQESK